jgi:SAM-dependent methyltransferase
MKILLNSSGIVRVQAINLPRALFYAGPVYLAEVGLKKDGELESAGYFPLEKIYVNLDAIKKYGMTVTFPDEANPAHKTVDMTAFSDAFIETNYLNTLAGFVKYGKWEVYSVYFRNGYCEVEGGLVLPVGSNSDGFVVLCDGNPPVEFLCVPDRYFTYSHWFMPEGCVVGYRARYKLASFSTWLEFSVNFPEDKNFYKSHYYRPIYNFTDVNIMKGLPDLPRIHKVSSSGANQVSFLNGGKTAYERIAALAFKYGIDAHGKETRILDWGVGCGRVTRQFANLAGRKIIGIDIDQDNVDWCNTNLGNQNIVVALSPPVALDDHSFDLIYSCSVLSHLDEKAIEVWLKEMARLLGKNGVALLSYNGLSNAASYLSRRPKEMAQLLKTGIFDSDVNHDLDSFITGDYYRATFCRDDWWYKMFSKYFKVVAIEHAVVSGAQDMAVLRCS